MFAVLPFIYVALGIIYGPIALWRRCKLRHDFKKLPEEQLTELDKTSPIYSGKGGIQITSLIFTGITLASALVLLAGILLSPVFSIAGSIGFLGLWVLYFIPLFVVGFNIPSVWNRNKVYLEELALKEKVPLVRTYYWILLPTWVLGVCASFVIAFSVVPGFIR